MPRKNLGSTTLRAKPSARDPMREFDRLPAELRNWMAEAMLPWRAHSVSKSYDKALARTGTPEAALRELDRIERDLVAKDVSRIWDGVHPFAQS